MFLYDHGHYPKALQGRISPGIANRTKSASTAADNDGAIYVSLRGVVACAAARLISPCPLFGILGSRYV
jgi:hypothetical protein